MLKVRVIPTLLWQNFGLVKGIQFDSWRRVGPVLPAIKVYNSRDVDELIFVDVSATSNGSTPDCDFIASFSEFCSIPLTVGGGITTLEHVTQLLHAGADKVCVNSAAFDTPELINQISYTFGSQCIVVSIDVKNDSEGGYSCHSHSGRVNRHLDPVEWAREVADRGAGEILLTSIDKDGTMQGYDFLLTERVASAVNIPVIASGGAGSYQHMVKAINESGADAIAAASIFHFTEQTPMGAKQALSKAGVPVRL